MVFLPMMSPDEQYIRVCECRSISVGSSASPSAALGPSTIISAVTGGNPLQTTLLELGIVSGRVALLPRSAEIQPGFERFVFRPSPTPYLHSSKCHALQHSSDSFAECHIRTTTTSLGIFSLPQKGTSTQGMGSFIHSICPIHCRWWAYGSCMYALCLATRSSTHHSIWLQTSEHGYA